MTVYTQISKKIGWEGKASIPSILEANQLLELVKKEDEYAFEKVFTIHRFAPSGTSVEHSEAMNIIFEAYKKGEQIFKRKG